MIILLIKNGIRFIHSTRTKACRIRITLADLSVYIHQNTFPIRTMLRLID